LFQIEFDLPTLAGILAVIGYSLNDTIVVFDRVKENFIKMRKGTPAEIMNLSLNQTLSRTIMTSFMTLLVVVALLIYGGPTLFGFSLALTVGIIVGTYSSIYVAGSLSLAMGLRRENLVAPPKEENRTI
jgi:preprotein translocase subunit SecF